MQQKIYIYDCDYLSFPNDFYNEKGMKLASFHKQLDDRVLLIRDNNDKIFNYDIIYIIKENMNSVLPPPEILGDPKAICYGAEMEYFPGYQEFPWKVEMVRPDYLFYNQDVLNRSRKENAQYLRLSSLDIGQDYRNSFTSSLNVVVDEDLWNLSYDKILNRLQKLKNINNIYFKNPIKLKPIIMNPEIKKLFMSLSFEKRIKNKFVNNYGQTEEQMKDIILFLSEFEYYKYFKPLKVQTITAHYNDNQARYDFFRALNIMAFAKKQQVRINLTCPKYKNTSYWSYFNSLKIWSNNSYKKSYLEFMTTWSLQKQNMNVETILSNRLYWYSLRTREIIYLINTYPEELKKVMFIEWGNTMLDVKIDYDYLYKEA